MSNLTRKVRRNKIKQELGTNEISSVFHSRYGYTPNVDKNKEKFLTRLKKKLRKLAHKKARSKRVENDTKRSIRNTD